MTAVVCECRRVCKSRPGFATHARKCPDEQARSAAFIAEIQERPVGAEDEWMVAFQAMRARVVAHPKFRALVRAVAVAEAPVRWGDAKVEARRCLGTVTR